MRYVCARCGWYGVETKTTRSGSFLVELALWLVFILPGLIYSLWRLSTRVETCPMCGEPRPLPENSPVAIHILSDLGIKPETPIPPSYASVRLGRRLGRLLRR